MYAYITHKYIDWFNAYRKPIAVAAVVAMIMALLGSCESTYISSVRVSAPTHAEIAALSEQIKQSVMELEYSDKVAEDFVNMVISWKDRQRRPVLVVWEKELAKVKEDHKQGIISRDLLAEAEHSIIKELGQRIRKEIDYNEKFFDLPDVVKHKQAQCVGYSQLVYIVGNSTGLSIKAINVRELMSGSMPIGGAHVACLVSLSNDKKAMLDLVPGGFVSKPFMIEKEFTKAGNYWEIRDKSNPLNMHRRIRILDRNGLIAGIYNNRGALCSKLDQFPKAISDYTKAIELDPKLAEAHRNRGRAYIGLGEYDKAISDCTKAIELDPKLAEAHCTRANAYVGLGQYYKAISDCTKAIELNPKFAQAYYSRGIVYEVLNKYEEAKKDLAKAVELSPDYEASIKEIHDKYKFNLKRPQTVGADSQHNLASIKNELLRVADNNADNYESMTVKVGRSPSGNVSVQMIVTMKSSVLLGLPELMEKLGIQKHSSEFKRLHEKQYIRFIVDASSGKYSID